ncbi:MAG TPA: FIST C-terminal domain-containing protein [Polyangiaceae bacterium]|nr:FIST C-terminal domain-containing protein [Polyangiaceae bacterium]
MGSAASFELVHPAPSDVAASVRSTLASLHGAAGGLVLLSGASARQAPDFAAALADAVDVPLLLACGAGVMTERGEHDNTSAAVGLLWRGGSCSPFAFSAEEQPAGAEMGARIAREVERRMEGRAGAAIVFAQPEVFPTTTIDAVRMPAGLRVQLLGGGVFGNPGAFAIFRSKVVSSDVVGLTLRGIAPPLVRASVACRLLGELRPVTEAEGALMLRIGGRSAIEELKDQAERSPARELLVVAIEVGRDPAGQRPRLVLRGIRGIHESRGGLVISEEIEVGTPVAFAVRDPAAARADLETTLREMSREMAGSMPRFGIYVDCAGRGSDMYGVGNVDLDLIRNRFPGLPLVGIRTSFEIGPGRLGSTIHLYSGVLSLFGSPS